MNQNLKHQKYPTVLVVLAVLLVVAWPRSGWAQLTYTTNNGAITITGYTGSGGQVTIPSTINGYPVTTIGTNAFYNQTTLTRVTIPDSVTSLSSGAFEYCSGLTSVTIPGSVTNIGQGTFGACSGLTNIDVAAANPSYAGVGGALFNKTVTTVIACPGGLTGSYAIPTGVTRIGDEAFLCCSNLTSVTIPDSVTRIGDEAFFYCFGLTRVAIGNSVTNIGEEAFAFCLDLTEVTIPDRVTNIGEGAFAYCSGLTNIDVAAANPSYASAGGVLFNQTLTTLIACPGGLTGSYAIPNGVTNLAEGAFFYCPGLTSVTIPDSVTRIGSMTFSECTALRSVTIPNSVTNIGDSAFEACLDLMKVTVPNRVTSIGNQAFYNCSGLTSVTIGNRVANIGEDAFCWCSDLTSVTIPNSVTNIGDSAFAYCSDLQEAYFQGNAPSVDGGAGSADSTVFCGESGTVYYVPGTTGWGATFGGWPTAPWCQPRPQILGPGYGLGAGSNGFQFTISWATNTAVVVEASTNLVNWTPISTNTLIAGTNAFWDSDWTHYPQRFYRVRSP